MEDGYLHCGRTPEREDSDKRRFRGQGGRSSRRVSGTGSGIKLESQRVCTDVGSDVGVSRVCTRGWRAQRVWDRAGAGVGHRETDLGDGGSGQREGSRE